ncbi:MAG: phenylalanine--tRNA ligase subunit beta [Bacteroidota bacterium]|nr:phenylalanine--tRNA ligase subunit beta [Bacteroidota bacterium]
MKIALNWLRDYISLDGVELENMLEKLSDSGLEVEGVEKYQNYEGGFEGLFVGEVISCVKHPNADKLKITNVEIGANSKLQIICGADNVRLGQKVVVATVGTKLFPFKKEPFTIRKSKIRGEISEGMLCAEDEIGLSENHRGIIELDNQTKIGMPLSELFENYDDTVFEIGITPNRADAISHYGVARDLKALFHKPICFPKNDEWKPEFKSQIQIDLQDQQGCPRYSGIEIRNVRIEESSKWMQNRLKSIGLSPINNVVDITNYVMHSIGQPLHAFDVDRVSGKKIIVRNAKENEQITTLDGQNRKLKSHHLAICDREKPMAIAGVFGGQNSGVNPKTSSIFIESAFFNASKIRKSAKENGLNTDASFRYERGTDPNITTRALQMAVQLLQKSQPEISYSHLLDIYPQPIMPRKVELKPSKLNRIAGIEIAKTKAISILHHLEMKVEEKEKDQLIVEIPPYRVDVTRDIDLIEEILRIFGFNNVPIPSKSLQSIGNFSNSLANDLKEKVSNCLNDLGFHELITNSMENEHFYDKSEKENLVRMLNPLSKNTSIMRMTLLHSALHCVAYNKNRQENNLKFFEFGKIYWQEKGKFHERNQLIVLCTGTEYPRQWKKGSQKIDAYFLAGILKTLNQKIGLRMDEDRLLREVKKVDPKFLKMHEIKDEIFYAEINWEEWVEKSKNAKIKIQKVSKFPKVNRDLALVVDDQCSYFELKKAAEKLLPKTLTNVTLFDVYRGNSLPNDKHSLGLSFTFHEAKKTMEEKEIEEIMESLIKMYEDKFGAEIRI